MSKAIEVLIVFLFSVGCLAYIYGVVKACAISLKKDPDVTQMPAFLSSIVTSIGAVLATNLGAVLGISIVDSSFAADKISPFDVFSDPTPTNVQISACYVYILTLLAASIVWGIKKFTADPKQVVSLIPELTKTLLGVIVGVLAITLAKKS